VAYLDREVFTALQSQTNPTLILKNVGRVFRGVLFLLYNSANARIETNGYPDPMQIWVNGFPLYVKPQHSWKSQMADWTGYGFPGAAAEAALGLDTGVRYWGDLYDQTSMNQNWNPADQDLPTVASTKINLIGTWGSAADHVVLLERTIKPSSGAALYS
jgi:hypothetical protein